MYCYRRYGHNEGDEPRFTQPLMYALIDKKPTVREVYVRAPASRWGRSRPRQAEEIVVRRRAVLDAALEEGEAATSRGCPRDGRRLDALPRRPRRADRPRWRPRSPTKLIELCRRAVDAARPTSTRTQGRRASSSSARERVAEGQPLDWGTGEMLAYASLLARRRPHPPQRAGLAARHVQPPPRGALRHVRTARATRRSRTARPRTRHASRSTTARSPRPACSASSTATASTTPTAS